MTNVRLIRTCTGELNVAVGDQYAQGARVSSINMLDGELSDVIIVPMKSVVLEEQSTVVPFKRD
ncbi:hypothetical protein [Bosea sp. LjRoot237]|uniref:hypothetical protein n=1 Tax=Bosea sp. LjRoot237 TaxID=3342292 RepID=UPI003ED13F3C